MDDPQPPAEPPQAVELTDAYLDELVSVYADDAHLTEAALVAALIAARAELADRDRRAPDEERALRKRERNRLAAMLRTNAATLQEFAPDGLPVPMVCFLLELDSA